MINGSRDVTTVATQALYMMNSDFVTAQAEAFADRVLGEDADSEKDRVDRAWQIALARLPSEAERNEALSFIEQTSESFRNERICERSPSESVDESRSVALRFRGVSIRRININ